MDSPVSQNFQFSNRATQSLLFGNYSDSIVQEFPSIRRGTIFPSSFDYFDQWYADILDAIASVLILKFLTDSFIYLKNIFFKRRTQSLAIQYIFDRFYLFSFSSFFTFRRNTYTAPQTSLKSNFLLRCLGLSFVLFLFVLELGLIYCQLRTRRTFSIEDVNIRTITLETGRDKGRRPTNIATGGCVPMVCDTQGFSKIPLYFCSGLNYPIRSDNNRESEIMFYFYSKPKSLILSILNGSKESVPYKFNVIHTIQVQNAQSQSQYLANLTSVGFNFNLDKITWMKDRIARKCNLSENLLTATIFNSTVSMIHMKSSNITTSADDRGCVRKIMWDTFYKMFRLTERTFSRDNFMKVFESTEKETGKDLLDNLTTGYVKRISGSTLWAILLITILINLIVRTVTWNIDVDTNKIIGKAFELEPGHTITSDGRNRIFEIHDENNFDYKEEGLERDGSRLRHRLSVQFS